MKCADWVAGLRMCAALSVLMALSLCARDEGSPNHGAHGGGKKVVIAPPHPQNGGKQAVMVPRRPNQDVCRVERPSPSAQNNNNNNWHPRDAEFHNDRNNGYAQGGAYHDGYARTGQFDNRRVYDDWHAHGYGQGSPYRRDDHLIKHYNDTSPYQHWSGRSSEDTNAAGYSHRHGTSNGTNSPRTERKPNAPSTAPASSTASKPVAASAPSSGNTPAAVNTSKPSTFDTIRKGIENTAKDGLKKIGEGAVSVIKDEVTGGVSSVVSAAKDVVSSFFKLF